MSHRKVTTPGGTASFSMLNSVLGYKGGAHHSSSESSSGAVVHVVDVLIEVVSGIADDSDFSKKTNFMPLSKTSLNEDEGEASEPVILQVTLSALYALSAVRLNLPKDLSSESSRASVLKTVASVPARFHAKKEDVPMLDPIQDMGITDEAFKALTSQEKKLRDSLVKKSLSTPISAARRFCTNLRASFSPGACKTLHERGQRNSSGGYARRIA